MKASAMPRKLGTRLLSVTLGLVVAGGGLFGLQHYRHNSRLEVLGEQLKGSGSNAAGASIQPSPSNKTSTDKVNGSDKKNFTITGEVTDLYPGIQGKMLTLTVGNPNNFAINVQTLNVTVSDAGGGCAASQITVTNFNGTFVVPGDDSGTQDLPITMDPDASPNCESARWVLRYDGSAVKA